MKMQKSKTVRVGKRTSQELFIVTPPRDIVMCNVKNKLLNKVVKDKIRMSVPVIHLFQLTEGYIPHWAKHMTESRPVQVVDIR